MDICKRDDVTIGIRVKIRDSSSNIVDGIVKNTITKVDYHVEGIKVELTNGAIGRIIEFLPIKPLKTIDEELIKEFETNRYQDEDENLEFKATFRFNMDALKYNNERNASYPVEHTVSKTIAAFGNTSGGTLYIGVENDSREIVGLNFDYELCKKQNSDGFMFDLKNSIAHLMDKEDFFLSNDLIRIVPYQGKEICVIKMKPSWNALIINGLDNKKEFYVRVNDLSESFTIKGFLNHWVEHIVKLRKL